MKNLLFSCILLLISISSYAQSYSELMKKLYSEKENKITYAIILRDKFSNESPDSMLRIGEHLVNFGIEKEIDSYVMFGKLILSNFYNTKRKMEISIPYLQDCITYYKKRKDFERVADAENLMGIAYIYSSDLNQAATYFIRSIKNADKLGENNTSFIAELNLCEVYIQQGKLELAEIEANMFLNKVKKKNYTNGVRKAYDYLTKIHLQKKDLKLANEYANKALEVALRNDSKRGKANAYNNLAIVNFELGDEGLALENFKKALKIRLEVNHPVGISESYFNLGDWNYYTGNLKGAIENFNTSLDVAIKNNLKKEQEDAFARLSETYSEMGDISKAFEMQNKYIKLLKENQKTNANNSFSYQQIAYELNLKEKEAKQKKREAKFTNQIQNEQNRGKIIVIGFSIIVGIFIMWQFYMLTLNKRKNKKNIQNVHAEINEKLKDRDARWRRIEHFISKKQHIKYQFKNIHFFDQFQFLKLQENTFLFFETGSTFLENYLFLDYLKENITPNQSESEIEDLVRNQKLIETQKLSFGFIKEYEGQLQLKGNGFILLKDQDTLTLSTSQYQPIENYKLILSDRLKNNLIKNNKWEQLVNHLQLIQNMSPGMAFEAFQESWKKALNEDNFGIIYIDSNKDTRV